MSKILVVEDDPDIRTLIRMRLRHAGHSVRAVEDAAAALESLGDSSTPDLLVLDVGLPDMDGFELLSQIRELPHGKAVPAIFLSARVQASDIARGTSLGATYLTKPFVTTALLNKVEALTAPQIAGTW